MTKSKKQVIVLIALLATAAIAYLWSRSDVPGFQSVSEADTSHFTPLDVQAPDLRLDLLKKIQEEEYSGSNRDIFSSTSPPPAAENAGHKGLGLNGGMALARRAGDPYPMQPPPPPPQPPVQVPAQFFGFESRHSGRKVAFFLNGEDVIIVAEGDPFLGNYRLIHIGNESADVEEMSSGRHATVPLEKAPDMSSQVNQQ